MAAKKGKKQIVQCPSTEQFAIAAMVVQSVIEKDQFFFHHSPGGDRQDWPEMVHLKVVLDGLRAFSSGDLASTADIRKLRHVIRSAFRELAGTEQSIGWFIQELEELAENQQSGESEGKNEILPFLDFFWRKIVGLRQGE